MKIMKLLPRNRSQANRSLEISEPRDDGRNRSELAAVSWAYRHGSFTDTLRSQTSQIGVWEWDALEAELDRRVSVIANVATSRGSSPTDSGESNDALAIPYKSSMKSSRSKSSMKSTRSGKNRKSFLSLSSRKSRRGVVKSTHRTVSSPVSPNSQKYHTGSPPAPLANLTHSSSSKPNSPVPKSILRTGSYASPKNLQPAYSCTSESDTDSDDGDVELAINPARQQAWLKYAIKAIEAHKYEWMLEDDSDTEVEVSSYVEWKGKQNKPSSSRRRRDRSSTIKTEPGRSSRESESPSYKDQERRSSSRQGRWKPSDDRRDRDAHSPKSRKREACSPKIEPKVSFPYHIDAGIEPVTLKLTSVDKAPLKLTQVDETPLKVASVDETISIAATSLEKTKSDDEASVGTVEVLINWLGCCGAPGGRETPKRRAYTSRSPRGMVVKKQDGSEKRLILTQQRKQYYLQMLQSAYAPFPNKPRPTLNPDKKMLKS